MPRTGDVAEIVRSHCLQETGLLVQVMGLPHRCECNCADCGQPVTGMFVEVYCVHEGWLGTPGPWFMPLKWLKRIDPRDPVKFAKVDTRRYRPVMPTVEQLIAANK